MATIIQRRFVRIPTSALTLAGEEYTRALRQGSSWMRIRMGILFAIQPQSFAPTSNLINAKLLMGMANGAGGGTAWNNTNFVGVSVIGDPTGTANLTYAANANYPVFQLAQPFIFARQSGLYTYNTALTSSTYNIPVAGQGYLARRGIIYLDINRNPGGTGPATINFYITSSNVVDYRPDQFLDGLDQLGTPIINTLTMTALTTAAVGTAETGGPLDTFSIYWSKTQCALEIYAVGLNVIYDSYTDASGNSPAIVPTVVAAGADEPFDEFTVSSSPISAATLNTGGTNWLTALANGSVADNGTINLLPQLGFGGTSIGCPFDSFDSYGTTTIPVSNVYINAGSGWASFGTIYGTLGPPAPFSGYAGTASWNAYDSFDGYGSGVVTSGVTIFGGSNWSTFGTFY